MPEPPTPDAEAEWLDEVAEEFECHHDPAVRELGRKLLDIVQRLMRENAILRGAGGHLERPHYVEPVNSELRLEPFSDLGDG